MAFLNWLLDKLLSSTTFEQDIKLSKIDLSEIFAERKSSYLNEFSLFLAHFNTIPNFITEVRIDCKAAGEFRWSLEEASTRLKSGEVLNSSVMTTYFRNIVIYLY